LFPGKSQNNHEKTRLTLFKHRDSVTRQDVMARETQVNAKISILSLWISCSCWLLCWLLTLL
jgi:hypothetical protein